MADPSADPSAKCKVQFTKHSTIFVILQSITKKIIECRINGKSIFSLHFDKTKFGDESPNSSIQWETHNQGWCCQKLAPHYSIIPKSHNSVIHKPHNSIISKPHNSVIHKPHNSMILKSHNSVIHLPHCSIICRKIILKFIKYQIQSKKVFNGHIDEKNKFHTNIYIICTRIC